MKKLMVFVLMLFIALHAFSQKKGKPDPKDLKIDSLTKANSSLTVKLDSVSKEREVYFGVYTAVKEKVLKYKYDPAKISVLIDSLKGSRDSTFNTLSGTSTSLKDSISVLNKENESLKATIKSLQEAEANKEKLVGELKQLKELLDAKIITQAEFDTKKEVLMQKWQ
jgi:hypothetical protein